LRNWRNLLEGEKLETNPLHGPRIGAVDRREERAFGLLRRQPEALKPLRKKGVIIPQNGSVRAGADPELGRDGDIHGRVGEDYNAPPRVGREIKKASVAGGRTAVPDDSVSGRHPGEPNPHGFARPRAAVARVSSWLSTASERCPYRHSDSQLSG
jgi:hypothetical protein